MQQMIDEDGNLWNVGADGAPVFAGRAPQQQPPQQVGPRPFTVGTPRPPEAKAPYRFESNDGSIWEVGPDGQPRQLFQDNPAPKVDEKGDAPSPAAVRAAKQLLSRLQLQNKSFVENFSGGGLGAIGEYNPFSGVVQEFNDYSTQMLPFAKQLSRSPGEGAQSDRDAADYRDLLPSNTERDQTNVNRMTNLRDTAIEVLRSAGEDVTPYEAFVPGQITPSAAQNPVTGAAALPRAVGAQADMGASPDGVTSSGGFKYVAGLRGIDQAVVDMIGKGADAPQVISFLNKAYEATKNEHGGNLRVGPDLAAWVGQRVAEHRANPQKPVRSLGQGWEILGGYEDPTPPSLMGRIADTTAGNFAMNAANAATAGLPAYLAGDQGAAVMQAAALERPGSSIAGEVAGGVSALMGVQGLAGQAGRLGTLLTRGGGLGGDVAYGAARGGFDNGPAGALTGALAAGVGNKVGSGLIGGVGRLARGISNPAVDYLASRGVPMTAGQLLGNRGIVGRAMSKMESLPLIGDSLAARRMDSFNAFNRAAIDDAGAGIGYSPSSSGLAGIEDGLKASGQAIDDATAGVNIQLDDQFQRELSDALARGEALPPDFAQKFALVNQNKVQPGVSSGTLSGDDYAEMTRGIKGYRAEHQKAGFEGDYRDALGRVQSALDGAIARGAGPEVIENLGKARTSYRDYKLLQNASERGQGGAQSGTPEVFTPAQLQAAVRASKYAQSGTNAPFYQLTKSGQEVLPSTVPNTGSADRGMAGLLLPATLGGGAVAAGQYLDPKIAAPLALLAALSSKAGAKVAQKALTGRGPTARAIGTKLVQQRRKAGLFGAATGVAMLPQLSQ
ncbi:hypothetical protein ACIPPQ_20130 [Sphingopyxis sp. LARHCG72]